VILWGSVVVKTALLIESRCSCLCESVVLPVPVSMCQKRVPANSTCNEDQVTLALVRWLSPHPRALLRDDKMLPVCPPTFGTNHALWTFSRTLRRRGYLTDHLFAEQLHLFPGRDRVTQRINADSFQRAMYDLIMIESFDTIMNCTRVDNDNDCILETVTLPFWIFNYIDTSSLNCMLGSLCISDL